MSFDLWVHKRNSQGKITQVENYRLVIEDGERKYERPVGSGKWYFENGDPIPGTKSAVKADAKEMAAEVLKKGKD